jgi:class 3 adenylate cyclase
VRELPTGTVTFLFTDIEGSTRLLKRLRERYSDVLAEHRRILREAAEARGGHEMDTQGDSFFFAFARANARGWLSLRVTFGRCVFGLSRGFSALGGGWRAGCDGGRAHIL